MAGVRGLRALFSGRQFQNVFDQFEKQIVSKLIKPLQFAGETFVNEARTNNTYFDDTGNLRSSIGYIILIDGKVVDASFAKQSGSNDGDLGKLQGQTFASEVADEFPKGLVLIGVAGMEYAASVEAHGYDVITGAASKTGELLKSILSEI